jgi:hypothetical protein
MIMTRSAHFLAAVVTILAVFIFVVLDLNFNFRFGLRTYWPAFLILYLIVWYFFTSFRPKRA